MTLFEIASPTPKCFYCKGEIIKTNEVKIILNGAKMNPAHNECSEVDKK